MTSPCSGDQRGNWSLPSQQRLFLVVVLLVFLVLYWTRIHGGFFPSPKDTTPSFFDPHPFVVDVQGSLRSPGIYTFPSPVKTRDVLLAAGVNRRLPEQAESSISLKTGTALILNQVDDALSVETKPMDGAKKILYGLPLDLNHARADELTLIPGIGPVLAQRILDHRNNTGNYAGLDDLLSVPGIGEKKLRSLEPYLCVEAIPIPTP